VQYCLDKEERRKVRKVDACLQSSETTVESVSSVSSGEESAPTTVVPPPVSSGDESDPTTVVPPPASSSDESDPTTIVPPPASSGDESDPTTIVPPPASSSDEESVTPTIVDPFTNGCDGQVPVMAIPASCQAYGCDQTKVIYDYTVLRVDEHNTRRRYHQNTPDVTYDLDIACQAYTWAKHMADNDDFSHAPSDQRTG